jgi:thiopeptide-type bacteriocin biosynthesis protein
VSLIPDRTGIAYARVCTLSAQAACETWLNSDVEGLSADDTFLSYLRKWSADKVLREAIEVASSSLGMELGSIDNGVTLSSKRLQRAFNSVVKYLLRTATRPTPFGIMAGVALIDLRNSTAEGEFAIGTHHTRGVRPDRQWLDDAVHLYQEDEGIVLHLAVQANNLCHVRGSRLVNPFPSRHVDPGAADSLRSQEVSVRLSPALEFILEVLTGGQRTVEELSEMLCEKYSMSSQEKAKSTLRDLIANEFLVTELAPSLLDGEPLDHVCEVLARIDSDSEHFKQLWSLHELIDRYARSNLGDGTPLLREINRSADAIVKSDHEVQIDLRTDVAITLPQTVFDELRNGSDALNRTGRAWEVPQHLVEYHRAFIEQYGFSVGVPLKALVDPDLGLGPPSTYDSSSGHSSHHQAHVETERNRHLGEWIHDAFLDGTHEIRLTDRHFESLGRAQAGNDVPAHELCCHLLAESMAAIVDGRFQILLSGFSGSHVRMNSFGRFMYMFPESLAEFREVARSTVKDESKCIGAQLSYVPSSPRLGNVASHPALWSNTIRLGTFEIEAVSDDGTGQHTYIEPDDLAVVAVQDRLVLFSISTGHEVRPHSYTMLRQSHTTNHIARLLRELYFFEPQATMSWSWGACDALPSLPRVTYKRAILTPARWRPPSVLTKKGLEGREWKAELDRWREMASVPAEVELTLGDNRIAINLEASSHRALLELELHQHPDSVLYEALPQLEENVGWSCGHVSEIVLPAPSVSEPNRVRQHIAASSWFRPRDRESHYPLGEWLYVKLYSDEHRQDSLLQGPIREFMERLPESVDRWFYLRYRDGAGSHMRFRFHCSSDDVSSEWKIFHEFFADLCRQGKGKTFVIGEYEPEVARYGDGSVLVAAEQAFCDDSRFALKWMAESLRGSEKGEKAIRGAENVLAIARSFSPAASAQWLTDLIPREREESSFRANKASLLESFGALLNGSRSSGALFGAATEGEQSRAVSLSHYGKLLTDPGALQCDLPHSRSTAFLGVIHMSHNRLFGFTPELERESRSIARSTAFAHLSRQQHLV